MLSSSISIIMPVYNQNRYIADAIQSVINQTYAEWELIIVDDGSTDSTADIITQFDDPRIRYIYQTNQGPSKARNTGIVTSSGQYITFLDADDLFHPHKIEKQYAHLENDRDIGLSYTAHIEIDEKGLPLNLFRAPPRINLKSLVLGFPLGINNILLRRKWFEHVGGFDESIKVSEDRDFYIRLTYADCQFERLDEYLVYRRLKSNRFINEIQLKVDEMVHVLESAFSNPLCPVEVLSLRNQAFCNLYLAWAYLAAIQDEIDLANEYFNKTYAIKSTSNSNQAEQYINFLVHASIRNGGDHEARIRKMFVSLPLEIGLMKKKCTWAIARGYFIRGLRDIMWDRNENGRGNFTHAAALGAHIDKTLIKIMTTQLIDYESEYGPEDTQDFLQRLSPYLIEIGGYRILRWLKGSYSVNQAFEHYKNDKFKKAITNMLQAIICNPFYLTNRGVIVVLIRSFIRSNFGSNSSKNN